MRYGAMNSPLRPLLEEVETLGKLGFDYLELTMDAPYAHYTAIRKQMRQVRQALARHGLALVCHLPTFVSTADLTDRLREASIQETLAAMRTAAELEPLKVVLHPSIIHGLGAMLRDLSERHAVAALERFLAAADDLNLTVCVENLMPSALSLVTPEQFDPVFAAFPRARLVLDTGHAYINGGNPRIMAFIDRFPDRIGHVHASDNFGRSDDHLPIGAGSINFPGVMSALRRIGYDDTITLEVFSPDRDYLRISRDKLAGMAAAADRTKRLTE